MEEPKYRIRALHTPDTVTVYQAYTPGIGLPAAREGRFPATWKRDRMTWIKPSFLWMMYRCGWGAKEGQETVLAVEITREGFEWALRNACLSHYVRGFHPDQASWKRQLGQAAGARPVGPGARPAPAAAPVPLAPARPVGRGLPPVRGRVDGLRHRRDPARPRRPRAGPRGRPGRRFYRLLPREEPYPAPDGLLDHLRAQEPEPSPPVTAP